MPNIRDVAKAAGVSAATVSRVINSPEKVLSGTLKKVQDAMALLTHGAPQEDEAYLAECVQRVVSERLGDLIVTPRDVDALVERMAGVVAQGINMALHPQLSASDIAQLTAQ